MASSSETGHAVNIANFKLLIDKDTAFGPDYNPSNTDLKIVNMTAQWTIGSTAHTLLTTALQNSKLPINAREILFEPLNPLVTKTINYYNSTKASKQAKKDAKGLADKIRGYGVKTVKLPDGSPDPAHISTSHQGFVQREDAFKQLIDLYVSDPLYAPNEAPLKTPALTLLQGQMKTSNETIGAIIAPVGTAMVTRNHVLYDEETGMIDIAKASKGYVKGVFGATSQEAKLVTGIKFTRPKK